MMKIAIFLNMGITTIVHCHKWANSFESMEFRDINDDLVASFKHEQIGGWAMVPEPIPEDKEIVFDQKGRRLN